MSSETEEPRPDVPEGPESSSEPEAGNAVPGDGGRKTPMDWLAKGKRRVRPDGKTNFEYPHELKVEVVLEVFKGNCPQSEISERYGVPQPLISQWRKTAIDGIINSLNGKRRGRPPKKNIFAIGGELSEAEALVLRVGATLRENTELLENSLRLLLGKENSPSEDELAEAGDS